jgi:hypothetical protein
MTVSGNKTHKFTFHSEEQAEEALGIIQSLWKKAERDAIAQEQVLARAVVVEPHAATNASELSLKVGEVVLIYQMDDNAEMWEGRLDSSYERGSFPKACVCNMQDATSDDNGYCKLEHVPTNAEWEQIIMGGREVTYRKVSKTINGFNVLDIN